MLPQEYTPRQQPIRPMSELINPALYLNEAEMTGRWYEDLQNYERNLDEMASVHLEQNFKDEMQHVDQWYRYLSEAEKTATMYTLLQHSTQVQTRFFINLLQQMVKRDSLYSLLTPNNPEQEMGQHLAGAMAKAELEASQRLMSVLPYKTGQVRSRPHRDTLRRPVDRHSFAIGDTEEYNGLFHRNNSVSDLLSVGSRSSFLLDEVRFGSNNERPRSVIEGDSNSLFSNWNNNATTTTLRPLSGVGHIGDRGERPKSADISNWNLSWSQQESDLVMPYNNGRRTVNNNNKKIHAVPEADGFLRNVFMPTNSLSHIGTNGMDEQSSDHDEESNRSRRRSSMVNSSNVKVTKDKKPVEVVDMDVLTDVSGWLRSLRLHKYNPIFSNDKWQDMIKMSDEDLLTKGVAALGARRKMLKVFESVKAHCEANNIEY